MPERFQITADRSNGRIELSDNSSVSINLERIEDTLRQQLMGAEYEARAQRSRFRNPLIQDDSDSMQDEYEVPATPGMYHEEVLESEMVVRRDGRRNSRIVSEALRADIRDEEEGALSWAAGKVTPIDGASADRDFQQREVRKSLLYIATNNT
jgi:hypothetical protein